MCSLVYVLDICTHFETYKKKAYMHINRQIWTHSAPDFSGFTFPHGKTSSLIPYSLAVQNTSNGMEYLISSASADSVIMADSQLGSFACLFNSGVQKLPSGDRYSQEP